MNQSDDKQLQDYLRKQDGVSAAYDDMRQEKPSAALDDKILQAARDAVGTKNSQSKPIPYQAYSIAASICLMVLAAALFLQNEDELSGADIQSRAIPLQDNATDDALQVEADFNQAAPAAANAQQARQAQEAAAETQASPLRLEAEQRLATGADTATEEQQAAGNANAANDSTISLQVFTAEQAGGLIEGSESLQEVSPEQPPYRLAQESWLLEIQRLVTAGEEEQLAEERRLFSRTYPDIDIDNAINELGTNN